MAGHRQHFIPRLIQRGFNSRPGGDGEAWAWTFRADGKVYETTVTNIGVESDFYTRPGDTAVDDKITDAEREFGKLTNMLRQGTADLRDPAIPRMLVHFEIRTRSLRKSLVDVSERLVNQLLDAFCDETHLTRMITRHLQSHPEILVESFAKQSGGRETPPQLLAIVQEKMPDLIPVAAAFLLPQIKQQTTLLRPMLAKQLMDFAKTGHMRALAESIHPEPRVARFSTLTYEVVPAPEGTLVLGDSCIILFTDRSPLGRPISDKDDPVQAVVLPLTPRLMLVGRATPRQIGEREAREAAIACSLEYFIAAENTQENRLAIGNIGRAAAPLGEADLEQIMASVLNPG